MLQRHKPGQWNPEGCVQVCAWYTILAWMAREGFWTKTWKMGEGRTFKGPRWCECPQRGQRSHLSQVAGRRKTEQKWVQSLGREDPLEEGMPTHSSLFAWRIPWTEEPGELQSIGSQSQTWLKRLSTYEHIKIWERAFKTEGKRRSKFLTTVIKQLSQNCILCHIRKSPKRHL